MKKIIAIFIILSLALMLAFLLYIGSKDKFCISPYPNGLNFAFTITDDPDSSSFKHQKIVYDYLKKKGIRSTIAVWVFKANRSNGIPDLTSNEQGGVTCQNPFYLKYVKELQDAGFEVALHGVSAGNDKRGTTIAGYEKFNEYFEGYPKINIMHRQNLENIYWGKKVFGDSLIKIPLGFFLDRSNIPYGGEIVDSDYFWGDLLKEKTKYVRLWGTSDINTMELNPSMPYHDKDKPFVNFWFSFSDGFNKNLFNELISPENVTKLVEERGACIVYTHFGFGFVNENELDKTFKERIDHLVSQKEGWFVPTSIILDRLESIKKIVLIEENNKLLVANLNSKKIDGITLIGTPDKKYFTIEGKCYEANSEGEIIIGKLYSGEAIVLINKDDFEKIDNNKYENKDGLIKFKGAVSVDKVAKINNLEKLRKIFNNQTIYNFSGRVIKFPEFIENYNKTFEKYNRTVIFTDKQVIPNHNEPLGIIEKYNMIFNRIFLYLKHNYN